MQRTLLTIAFLVSAIAAQAQQIYNCDATGLIPQPQKLTEEVADALGVAWPPESPAHFLVQEVQGDGQIFWSDSEKDALYACQPIHYIMYVCDNFGNVTGEPKENTLLDLEVYKYPPYPDQGDYNLVRYPHQEFFWSSAIQSEIESDCRVNEEDNIRPIDGMWRVTVDETSNHGCPPAVATALETKVFATGQRAMIWGESFHPSDLILSEQLQGFWEQTGPNDWQVVAVDTRSSAMTFSTEYILIVEDERTISIYTKIIVTLSPDLAQVMKTEETCEANAEASAIYLG